MLGVFITRGEGGGGGMLLGDGRGVSMTKLPERAQVTEIMGSRFYIPYSSIAL